MEIYIISFILLTISIFLLTNISFKRKRKENITLLSYSTLREITHAKDKSIISKIKNNLNYHKYILTLSSKKSLFYALIYCSFTLFIISIALCIILNNYYLLFSLPILLSYIPIFILEKISSKYESIIFDNLRSYLSLINSSYIRCNDIIKSFSENLKYIKDEKIKEIFSSFVFDYSLVNSDIKSCLVSLKSKIKMIYFEKYCDLLIECIDNPSSKSKLNDITSDMDYTRRSNMLSKRKIKSILSEYYIMALLLVLNYPIIYFINQSWFYSLISSTLGKIIISFTILYIALSSIFLNYKIRNVGIMRRN